MIALVLQGLRRLLTRAPVVVLCWAALVALDHVVGIGWISRLDPQQLPTIARSPHFVAMMGTFALVRIGPLLLVANALVGRGLPDLRRVLGVCWSELVLRALPTVALLAFAGFFRGNSEFGPMDIGAIAMLWLVGAGASDLLAMYRPERWGIYAESEPRLLVLARVAVGQPSEVTVLSPAGVVALVCAVIAANARLTVAFGATGVLSPPLPPGVWWVALISAALLDLLTVSLSVGAWRDGQTAAER